MRSCSWLIGMSLGPRPANETGRPSRGRAARPRRRRRYFNSFTTRSNVCLVSLSLASRSLAVSSMVNFPGRFIASTNIIGMAVRFMLSVPGVSLPARPRRDHWLALLVQHPHGHRERGLLGLRVALEAGHPVLHPDDLAHAGDRGGRHVAAL